MRPELALEHRVFARALTCVAARTAHSDALRDIVALAGHDATVLERALDHGRVLLHVVGRDDICEQAVQLVRQARAFVEESTVPA